MNHAFSQYTQLLFSQDSSMYSLNWLPNNKYLVDRLNEWCLMPLSTVFQSYHSNSSHYSFLSWVSPVLDWALKCLAQGHSHKKKTRGSSATRTQHPWITSQTHVTLNKYLDWTKFRAFAHDKRNVAEIMNFVMVENFMAKKRKYHHFLLFPQCFLPYVK